FTTATSSAGINSSYVIERLEFADGSSVTWEQITQQGLNQQGTAGDDTLLGHSGIDELHGGAGNDTLDGGTGTNRLYGEDGDDVLQVSSSSKDSLFVGGKGNDRLYGGYHSDTYQFDLGDGVDTIYEMSGGYAHTDVLRFGEGIQASDIQAQRSGSDLVLAHTNGTDKVIVKNVFTTATSSAGINSSYVIERLEFADGSSVTWEQI